MPFVELTPCAAGAWDLRPLAALLKACRDSEDHDVANKTIGVYVDPIPPFTIVKPPAELTGYNGDIWNILQTVLGFRTRLLLAEGFAEAQRGLRAAEGDVFLHPIVITRTDVDHLDFSGHVASTWYELYVKRPASQATWQAYVHACSSAAWAAILASVALLVVARSLALAADRRHGVGVALLSVLGAIFNQGVQESWRRRGASQRVLTTFTLVFGLLLVNAYSAVLTARLTVVVTPLPFGSLDELASVRSHALCVREHNFADSLFTTAERGQILRRWRGVVRHGPCADFSRPAQVRDKACQDGVALLETPALVADADAPCVLTRVDARRYARASTALQFRRRFPYAAPINSMLQRMHEAGVTQLLRNKWITKPLPLRSAAAPEGSVVPSKHYEAILALYMAAVALSVGVCLFEVVLNDRNKYKFNCRRRLR